MSRRPPHLVTRLGLRPMGAQFRPTSAAYLARVEDLLGAALPAAYRDFLGRFGVCTLAEHMAVRLPDGAWAEVHVFLGNDPDDSFDLTANIIALAPHPAEAALLPFARDALGNPFCLRIPRPPAAGDATAHYVDLLDDRWQAAADSFADFLARLQRPPC